MVELGQKVKDSITGFEGIATGKCIYLNGCIQIQVRPIELRDGRMIDSEWIDEQRLTNTSEATNGGPQDTPPSLSTPN